MDYILIKKICLRKQAKDIKNSAPCMCMILSLKFLIKIVNSKKKNEEIKEVLNVCFVYIYTSNETDWSFSLETSRQISTENYIFEI